MIISAYGSSLDFQFFQRQTWFLIPFSAVLRLNHFGSSLDFQFFRRQTSFLIISFTQSCLRYISSHLSSGFRMKLGEEQRSSYLYKKIEAPRDIHHAWHKLSHSADVSIRFCVLWIKQVNCTLRNATARNNICIWYLTSTFSEVSFFLPEYQF